jgi:hypothetical protein
MSGKEENSKQKAVSRKGDNERMKKSGKLKSDEIDIQSTRQAV